MYIISVAYCSMSAARHVHDRQNCSVLSSEYVNLIFCEFERCCHSLFIFVSLVHNSPCSHLFILLFSFVLIHLLICISLCYIEYAIDNTTLTDYRLWAKAAVFGKKSMIAWYVLSCLSELS